MSTIVLAAVLLFVFRRSGRSGRRFFRKSGYKPKGFSD